MAKKNKTKLLEWQIKARAGGTCEMCGQESKHLTVDHIVPVHILTAIDETGDAIYEDESNFQLLCRLCNVLKGNRLNKRHPRTKEIILKYL